MLSLALWTLNTMVRDTVTDAGAPDAVSWGGKVETELSRCSAEVLGNRGKLQQVLVNLVLNAKDALQDKTHGTG